MTTVEIVLAVLVAVWLVQYVSWGLRVKRAINQHKALMWELHGGGGRFEFPPDSLSFP